MPVRFNSNSIICESATAEVVTKDVSIKGRRANGFKRRFTAALLPNADSMLFVYINQTYF